MNMNLDPDDAKPSPSLPCQRRSRLPTVRPMRQSVHEGGERVLEVLVAPFMMSGLLAIAGGLVALVFIVVFFMLADRSCAVSVVLAIGVLVLLFR